MAQVGIAELASMQQGMTDQQKTLFMSQYAAEKKDRTIALILALLLGFFGVDRFYIGETRAGFFKLLTLGLFGLVIVSDWFLIMEFTDEINRAKAQEIAARVRASAK